MNEKVGQGDWKLLGLSHMAFFTKDMDASIAHYRDVLGFHLQERRREGQGAVLSLNERQFVELHPEQHPDTNRLVSFGFQVEGLAPLQRHLQREGIVTEWRTAPGAGEGKALAAWDPDGHRVDFIEARVREEAPGGRGEPLQGPGAISRSLMHLGFTVFRLDRAKSFYGDVLGFKERWRGSRDGRSLAWVQFALPTGKDYIEFMLYEDPPSLEWLGIWNHIGLEVPTIEGAHRDLAARPYPKRLEPQLGICRHRLMNVYDPDGSRAELMERETVDGLAAPSSDLPPPR